MIRAIKERSKIVLVDNDLRGLGSIVQDRPPHYETKIKPIEGKTHLIRELVKIREMRLRETHSDGHYITTPESISFHEQAVWHFFLAAELVQHDLVSRANIYLIQPLAAFILHEKPNHYSQTLDPSDALVTLDGSLLVFMMQAGHWKNHFSESEIKQQLKNHGQAKFHLDRPKIETLFQELKLSALKTQKVSLTNAK